MKQAPPILQIIAVAIIFSAISIYQNIQIKKLEKDIEYRRLQKIRIYKACMYNANKKPLAIDRCVYSLKPTERSEQ